MLTNQKIDIFYQALLNKDSSFEGVFFVGVKSTGIFCRPSCPAKKPKLENCEFFTSRQEALLASYRPCKRCRPLKPIEATTPIIDNLVELVEKQPNKKWKLQDIRKLGYEPSTVSRQFKKYFDMTFIEYSRSRRIGLAMQNIRFGNKIIDTQLDAGYESASCFWDAFQKIMKLSPSKAKHCFTLDAAWLETELGPMLVLANENGIHLLEFVDRRGLENEIKKMREKIGARIIPGNNDAIKSIKSELHSYFSGKLKRFKTPFVMHGSEFQQIVWQELIKIPFGETISYKNLAERVGGANFSRAVARANGANQLALIIPCHRVINTNGELGGYGGGIARKTKLLELERN